MSFTLINRFPRRKLEFFDRFYTVKQREKVLLAISGGVDSAASLSLLLKQGYEVDAVHIKSWDEKDEKGFCMADKELEDVQHICDHFNTKLITLDYVKEYWNDVFMPFLDSFSIGRTPNPDVNCNKMIKFGPLLQYSRDNKYSKFATGHFAQISTNNEGEVFLHRAAEHCRDQSYFLCTLNQNSLKDVMFPVGHLTKNEIREIARKANIHVAEKRSSVGICFVGKRKFKDFIGNYIPSDKGKFVDLNGQTVGLHNGHILYTIGQRANIGGCLQKYFVVGKDVKSNTVRVVPGEKHPELFKNTCLVSEVSWVSYHPPNNSFRCDAIVRYSDNTVPCKVEVDKIKGQFIITFDRKVRITAPGQHIVLYHKDVCLGGGQVIEFFQTENDVKHLPRTLEKETQVYV